MTAALEGGWVVSSTPRPHFTPGKDPVPILQEAEWATGPVWTGGKSRPHLDSIPDRTARSQLLYRLSYRAHIETEYVVTFLGWSYRVVKVTDYSPCMSLWWGQGQICIYFIYFVYVLEKVAASISSVRIELMFQISFPKGCGSIFLLNMGKKLTFFDMSLD